MLTEIIGPEIANGSDSRSNEIRIWGPPGCGKTTYEGKQIRRAADKYGPNGVLVTSFTKAAATELSGRDLPLARGAVGTLHSHCYRALGRPVIAETKITDWNKDRPRFRLSPTESDVDEIDPEHTARTFGDEVFAKFNILRAQMVPPSAWPLPVRRFASDWTEWKRANGLMDFTDLIEAGLHQFRIAPGNPRVIVVDESQDLTRQQLTLVRQWGRHADYIMLAADDDQTIYSFAGAAPEALLEKDGDEHFRYVLSQSYRVPRAVHALSQAWIQQVELREAKEYRPREEDGEVKLFHRGNFKQPQAVVDDAERRIANGETVMFLAACSYMLEPLKRLLRERGIPFHNPYRRKRLDWNPLMSAARGCATVDRVWAYLRPRDEAAGTRWTGEDLQRWTAWLGKGGGMFPGAAETIKQMNPTLDITPDVLAGLFEPDHLASLIHSVSALPMTEYMAWWLSRLQVNRRKAAAYPALVACKRGVPALGKQPQVILGTAHSVKGGEADVVYLFPDLSASGWRQWHGPRRDRDAIIRLGYVAITRCRKSLVLCDPVAQAHMPIAALAGKINHKKSN